MKKLLGFPHASWFYSLTIVLVVFSLLFSPLAGLGSRALAEGNESVAVQTGAGSEDPGNITNPEPATSPLQPETDPGNLTEITQIIPDVPPVISGVQVTTIMTTWATVVWTTDKPADTVVNYGTSTGLGLAVSDAGLATDHSILLTGLEPGVTYYYEVQSTDYSLNTVTDNNGGVYYSFTTPSSDSTQLDAQLFEPQPSEPQKIEPLKAIALVSPDEDVELKSPSEKITLNIPAGAASENLRIDFTELTPWGSTGMKIVNLFELNAYAVDRADAMVSQFQKELTITVKHTPEDLRGLDTDSLRLYYLDELTKQWVPVPSKYDSETMIFTATVNHFTIYGQQATPTISGPGRIMAFQVDMHSGTATANYPIEVPPGPGDFKPRIELTYNSGVADGMKNKRSVGSWVGIGWSLNLGSVSFDEGSSTYFLTLNGQSYTLVQDPGNPSVYHTVKETFYKITRSGQTWTLYDRDGVSYRFGGTASSQQYHDGNQYYRWDLDLIQDTHSGNTITVTYVQDIWNNSVRSAYPLHVYYNNNNVDITFNSSFDGYDPTDGYLRTDTPRRAGTNPAPKVVENRKLDSIEVKLGTNLVRKYNFAYTTTSSNYSSEYGGIYYSGKHTLTSITQVDVNNNPLPATTFSYTDLQTFLHLTAGDAEDYVGNPGNPASFNWPHLTSVSNGYGGTTTFTYTQIPAYSAPHGPDNIWTREVVTNKTINPGIGPTQTYQYTYTGNPQYYPSDASNSYKAEYRGFSEVKETDAAGHWSTHSYWTTGTTQAEYLTGKEKYTEWDNSSGQPLKAAWYTWGSVSTLGSNLAYFVRLEQGNTTIYPIPSGSTKTSQTRYFYDSYGNVIKEYRDGDTSTSDDDATVYRVFNPNTTANILDKPARERTYATIVTEDNGGANLKSETLYYYDSLAYGQPPTKGDLTKVERKKDASTSLSTNYTYDPSYGNMLTEQDPKSNTTTYVYDSTYHVLPISKQYPTVGSLTMYEYYAWDYGSGKITSDTDVNSQATTYEYDTFKRLVKVIKPGDSSTYPTIQYEYNNWGTINQQHLKTSTRISGSTYIWQKEFFDGLGRVVQTQAKGETEGSTEYTIISATTTYNNRGLVDRGYTSQKLLASSVTNYYTPASDWKYTTYAYDALGRVTTQTNADNTTIGHDYSIPWRDQITDQRGFKTNNYYDAFQRLVKVEELDAFNVLYSTTTYSYNVLNSLVQVKDNKNNTSTMNYDWLSRKTSMSDPDMGSWSYGYDNNSNLTTQNDAKGNTTTFSYDALNRLTAKSGTGLSVSYTYDSTLKGSYGKGLRYSMSDASGSTAYYYDARGRLIREDQAVDGVLYTTQYGYDSADRQTTVTYPTGETVTQTYNGRGLPDTLSGSVAGNIVTSTLYNKLGQYTEINLNNGVKTTFGYWGVGGSYDASGGYYGRLSEIKSAVGSNVRQDMKYTWDASGNLAQRVDSDGYTETFTYDFLDRLTSDTGAIAPGGGSDSNIWYPMSSGTTSALEAVWGSSSSNVFAVGRNNTIVHYDGSAWTSMSGATHWLYGVWGSSPSDVFAVGWAGTIDHYNGSSWTAMSSPTSYQLMGVWGSSSSDVFAVGAGGTIVHYNGTSWSTMTSGTTVDLHAIWGTSSSNVFVVGNSGKILRYNGTSWSTMTSGTTNDLYGVWGSSGSDVFAVGGSSTILHYNGSAWSQMSGVSGTFRSVWGSSSSDVFAVGDSGVIYHYNGSAWSLMYSGLAFWGVWGSSFEDVFAVGDNGTVLHYTMPSTETYVYDQIGNIIYKNRVPYTYGSKPHAVTSVGSTSYAYDANGNMITHGNQTITYDVENRPVSITDGVNTTTFVYDGDGNRIKKIEGGHTTVYIGKYYEKNISTGIITTYYYLGDRLVALRSGTNLRYTHLDHLGSISVVTDASGNTIGSIKYYPYGSTRASSGSLNTDEKFTGQRLDGTGLYYYGARYYDPNIGRFISPDSIVPNPANPQSLNRYSYCLNNPLRYNDPSGHQGAPPAPPVLSSNPVIMMFQIVQWTYEMAMWSVSTAATLAAPTPVAGPTPTPTTSAQADNNLPVSQPAAPAPTPYSGPTPTPQPTPSPEPTPTQSGWWDRNAKWVVIGIGGAVGVATGGFVVYAGALTVAEGIATVAAAASITDVVLGTHTVFEGGLLGATGAAVLGGTAWVINKVLHW
jgi:RHS repeat-associated protein